MDYSQLRSLVASHPSTTLVAARMREACHLPPLPSGGRARDRDAKSRKYRDAARLMRQRHGVRM